MYDERVHHKINEEEKDYHESLKEIKSAIDHDNNTSSDMIKNVNKSIIKASEPFQLKDNIEVGELIIENERLKQTLGLLNSNLKIQTDAD